MSQTLHILHVEDSPDDSELVKFALRDPEMKWTYERVDTEPEYVAQLEARMPDVIICDFDMPRFTAGRALDEVRPGQPGGKTPDAEERRFDTTCEARCIAQRRLNRYR